MLIYLVVWCKGNLAKRLPLGGEKTASSLSRQRLMRGDQSPPTISTNHYNKLLSIGTERHMGCSLQYSAIHECRDSACRRPFGVRRNAAGVCSEMTQCVKRFVRYNRFVAMLLIQNHTCTTHATNTPRVILSGAARISKIKR